MPAPKKTVKRSSVSKSNPKTFKKSGFSRNQLIAFVLVFGAIGGFFIYRSFAAAPVLATKQGETLGGYANGGATVINDKTASGGQALRVTTNTALGGATTLSSNATSFSVIARATSCSGGWPWLDIYTNSNHNLPSTKISSTSWKTYSSNVPTTGLTNSESQYVTIYVTNNGVVSKACSRYVDIDVISYYGPNTKTAALTLQGLTKL